MAYKKRRKYSYGKRYRGKYKKFRSKRRRGMLFNKKTNVIPNRPFVLGDKKVVGLSDRFDFTAIQPPGFTQFTGCTNDVNDPQETGGLLIPMTGAQAMFELWENAYTIATEVDVNFICKDATYAPCQYALWASVDAGVPVTWEHCVEFCKQSNGRFGDFSMYQRGHASIKVYPGRLVKADWKDIDTCAHPSGRVIADKRVYFHVAIRNLHPSSNMNLFLGVTMNSKVLFYGARQIT